jgi:flagellar hook-associated protein 3 FlgL
MLRVTDGMGVLSIWGDLQRIRERMELRQREATSGARVRAGSDDPAGAAGVLRTDAELAATRQCRSNVGQAEGELGSADTALGAVGDLLAQARELALAMANGSYTAEDRARAALEVQEIRRQLIALANTQHDGSHIFGGYITDRAPFDPTTGLPVGDVSGVRRVLATPTLVVEASVSGAEAFTVAGGRDIQADLTALATALSTSDLAAIGTAIDNLAADQTQVTTARAKAGVYMARLRGLGDLLDSRALELAEGRSRIADADIVETLSSLAQTQQALNGALQVSAQMLSKLTLVDKL